MRRKETGFKKNISREEIDKLISCVLNPKIRTIIRTLQYTGLRIGDCVKIQLSDISPDLSIIRVETQKTGKVSDKPIPKKLRKELKKHIKKHCKKNNPFLFPSRNNPKQKTHISTASIRWAFLKARKKSGLDDAYFLKSNNTKLRRISPHTLRHYFATQVYEKSGYDLEATKQMLDHTKIDTTSKYYIDNLSICRKIQISEMIS